MLTTTDIDVRPASEYLYVYNRARKEYRHLYYCRHCVINFDVKERTTKCEKCGNESVVELPKEVDFGGNRIEEAGNKLIGRIMEDVRAFRSARNVPRRKGPDVQLLRLRILFHYLTVFPKSGDSCEMPGFRFK